MVGLNLLGGLYLLMGSVFIILFLFASLLPWRGHVLFGAIILGSPLLLYYGSEAQTAYLVLWLSLAAPAILLAVPVHVWFRARVGPLHPNLGKSIVGLYLIPTLAYMSIDRTAVAWHAARLPANIHLFEAVYVPRHFASRCEVTVWTLKSARDTLHVHHSPDFGWKPTPYAPSLTPSDPRDRWLRAIACSSMKLELRDQLVDAITTAGSYYLNNGSEGFLISPAMGYVAHLYAR